MGRYVTICGGFSNVANGQYSAIGGGYSNDAEASYCGISAGYSNTAHGSARYQQNHNVLAMVSPPHLAPASNELLRRRIAWAELCCLPSRMED